MSSPNRIVEFQDYGKAKQSLIFSLSEVCPGWSGWGYEVKQRENNQPVISTKELASSARSKVSIVDPVLICSRRAIALHAHPAGWLSESSPPLTISQHYGYRQNYSECLIDSWLDITVG
jgi:hypothetical protein